MAWASPAFDDSDWNTQDLTPPPGSYDPVSGSSGFVPGWTTQGYPKLIHYAWYRLRVQVSDGSSGAGALPLAIDMPFNFDDAYQLYVNGREIGHFGEFNPHSITFFNAQPRSFPLPSEVKGGTITIAIRMWMDAGTPLLYEDAGGLHGPPLLGEASAIDAMLRLAWETTNRTQVGNIVESTFLLLAIIFSFTLFVFDRSKPTYLWLGLVCFVNLLWRATVTLGYYSTLLPMVFESVMTDIVFAPLTLGLWAIFWANWFGLENIRKVTRIVWALVVCIALGAALVRPPIFGSLVPVSAGVWLVRFAMIVKLLLGVVLLWITYRGMRKRAADAWLALVPILLTIVWAYEEELSVIHIPSILVVAGFPVSLGVISMLLMLGIISLLMLRGFIRDQRENARLKLEIEQARQVQHVLIPEAIPSIPGLAIESEYCPAQQVGGDFFQILRTVNGGVLAVIGDVSGKGTPAAMTVSLLVGTIRTLAHYTQQPKEILSAMNQRMCGRTQGGFTTCLALRVDPDGTVTFANAGHPAPYVQGHELMIENDLPLGLDATATYPESTFHLSEGERLAMFTDGVAEARNPAGELFGFARTAAISCEPAISIVHAAQDFGQADDITVVTITRLAPA